MNILGTGIISTHGRGEAAMASALLSGTHSPVLLEVPFQSDPFALYTVPDIVLKDPVALRCARRADRFSRMAVLAAWDAFHSGTGSGSPHDPARTGLVVGSAFGPHVTTFGFLDNILAYGESAVSPTRFSHSVHNLAAGYISMALDLQGPALTLTDFVDPFRAALQTAQLWLEQGMCDDVIVGCVDECGTEMEYICSQKLAVATSPHDMRPFFDPRGPVVIPGEGAVFLRLSRSAPSPLCISIDPDNSTQPDLLMINFEAQQRESSSIPLGCWSHQFGTSSLSSAFHCVVASSMITQRTTYQQSSLLNNIALEHTRVLQQGPHVVGCGRSQGKTIYIKENNT